MQVVEHGATPCPRQALYNNTETNRCYSNLTRRDSPSPAETAGSCHGDVVIDRSDGPPFGQDDHDPPGTACHIDRTVAGSTFPHGLCCTKQRRKQGGGCETQKTASRRMA